VWRRPWLWTAVVSALAVGVVVGVVAWPREPRVQATVDFGQFSLGKSAAR
jgi:hypothetical protein